MAATRKLGSWSVPPVGLGCMNLSHAYGIPPGVAQGEAVLQKALDLGTTHFDSAALYGFGRNEELVGPFLKSHRKDIVLVSKCGMRGENGKRTIDARPEKLRDDLENSLRRLQTDVIDLYYLHRYDKVTPIEESVGEMSRFVDEGKVRAIGLSEVSASTVRKAHAVHPITAVQSEYSLWSRNVEIAVLDTCKELGISFVSFSPLARGFLTSVDIEPAKFAEKDIRRGMPRFNEPHFSANLKWLVDFRRIADEAGCSPSQLALAWVLQRGKHVHVIPGTTSIRHLEENIAAADVILDDDVVARLDALISPQTVSGPRYPAPTQAEIDTEEFDHASAPS
ncbi:MAG: aldo/keto reductase [Woeseiaceae bacterium]|nr:aldo/keto reductase [Woeseiaceae bacterium]